MTIKDVPLTQLSESPHNPRKTFDKERLAELAQSIQSAGIIEPIVVRPTKKGFEIIAGARRYRAAGIAKLKTVPCSIRDMSDEQAREIQLIENIQREDLAPLEEGESYSALLKLPGYTAELIAEKVKRDVTYVYRRIRLHSLIKPAKAALTDGRIQVGHALAIAALPTPAEQERAFQFCFPSKWDHRSQDQIALTDQPANKSGAQLNSFIRDNITLLLSAAPWKKDDPNVYPPAGPCTTCPKRTGANLQLFDDMGKGDRCLDTACFHIKQTNHLTQLAAANPDAPRVAMNYVDDATEKKLAILRRGTYIHLTSKSCGSTERALVAAGGVQLGQFVFICRDKKCKKHGSVNRGFEPADRDIWGEKRKRLEETIKLKTRRSTWLQIREHAPAAFARTDINLLTERLVDRIGHDQRKEVSDAIGLEPAKNKNSGRRDYEGAIIEHAEKLTDADANKFLIALSLSDGLSNLGDGERMKQATVLYKIDVAGIRSAIATPALAKFNESKAKAKARDKEAAKVAPKKKAAKGGE